MNRNTLYLVIAVLLVAIGGFALYTYQEESKPKGVELQLNENGVKLEQN